MTLSKRARQFIDTAFELALTEEFMGGPTAEERQNIEAIRTEIDGLEKRLALTRAGLAWQPVPDGVYGKLAVAYGGRDLGIQIDDTEIFENNYQWLGDCMSNVLSGMPYDLRVCRRTTAQDSTTTQEVSDE